MGTSTFVELGLVICFIIASAAVGVLNHADLTKPAVIFGRRVALAVMILAFGTFTAILASRFAVFLYGVVMDFYDWAMRW